MKKGIEIFFSYASQDEELLEGLRKQLRVWEREGLISTWHARNINAGTERQQEINRHLNGAQIILLLISPDFMASDYHHGIEVKQAMSRQLSGDARIIPIILRPVVWEEAPFGRLQPLPKNRKAITLWPDKDEAFQHIAQQIKIIAENLLVKQYLKEAEEYFGKGDYDQAIEEYTEVLNLRSTASAYQGLGRTLFRLQRYEDALSAYNQALDIDNHVPALLQEKGDILLELGQYEEAIITYNQALQPDTQDALGWINKGYAFLQLHQYKEALAAYNQACLLNPHSSTVYRARGEALEELRLFKDGGESDLLSRNVQTPSEADSEMPRYFVKLIYLPRGEDLSYRGEGPLHFYIRYEGRLSQIASTAIEDTYGHISPRKIFYIAIGTNIFSKDIKSCIRILKFDSALLLYNSKRWNTEIQMKYIRSLYNTTDFNTTRLWAPTELLHVNSDNRRIHDLIFTYRGELAVAFAGNNDKNSCIEYYRKESYGRKESYKSYNSTTLEQGTEIQKLVYDKSLNWYGSNIIHSLTKGKIYDKMIGYSGKLAFLYSDDKTVECFIPHNTLPTYTYNGAYGKATAIALSKDERHLAIATEKGVIFITDGNHSYTVQSYRGSERSITCLAIVVDLLYIGYDDGTVDCIRWDINSASPERHLWSTSVHANAIIHMEVIGYDGLVTADKDTIHLWSVDPYSYRI